MDRAVLGATEGEHVAAPVAVGELGDPVAPLGRAVEVEHGRAGPDEHAERPGARDRDRRFALERRRRGLVETAHALVDTRTHHERRALERQPQHLQVGDAEAPAQLGRTPGELEGGSGVTAAERDVALVEREPAVLRSRLERVEQAMRPLQPSAGHRPGAAEVELVGGEPDGHAGGAGRIAALLVEPVGALAGGEDLIRVVEPPTSPAKPLQPLGALLSAERAREDPAGVLPTPLAQLDPADHERVGRRRVRCLGHEEDCPGLRPPGAHSVPEDPTGEERA
jgi:hypothetical protein